MNTMIAIIGELLWRLSDLFLLIMLAWIILGWLLAFGVISWRTPLVANVMGFCEALVGPLLNPIRRFIPAIGGIDITPIFLLIGIQVLKNQIFIPMAYSNSGF